MTVEDRLRRAIEARTSTVEPAFEEGLERIDQRLRPQGPRMPSRPPWLLAAAAIALLAAVVGGLVLIDDEDGDKIDIIGPPDRQETTETTDTPTSTTTTEASGPGTSPTSETPTVPPSGTLTPPADVVEQAVWPRPSSEVRFDEPAAAARSFALYLAHFPDPVVGDFRPGGAASGEVPVQPTATGPETTVLVRKLSDDHWYVTGSVTEDITVDRPAAGAVLASPQTLTGQALAYEGTVMVDLYAYLPDGRSEHLAHAFVTGGGGPAAPFTGSLDWEQGSAELEPVGVLVFSTSDERDESGGAWQVVAIPVRLTP